MGLRVKWGHASAQQLGRVLVDSDWDNMRPPTNADEVLEQCEVCRSFDEAPRVSFAHSFLLLRWPPLVR